MRLRRIATLVAATVWLSGSPVVVVHAAPPEPSGVIAVSGGDDVTLVLPGRAEPVSIQTGTVGFLYPAPGGLLFAPDLVNGRTTVINLPNLQVAERFPGITQPHFGPYSDRYLVVAGDLVFVTWPERSLIRRVNAEFSSPWQVFLSPEGVSALVFERPPTDDGPATLTAVDLTSHRQVGRRVWPNGIARVAVGMDNGLLAAVNTNGRNIEILDLSSMRTVTTLATRETPRDAVFALKGERMLSAVGDVVVIHRIKSRSKGTEFRIDDPVQLDAPVIRLATAPDDRWVAAVTETPEVVLIDARRGEIGARWPLPDRVRDVVWCQRASRGPSLPVWTVDGGGPETIDPQPDSPPR
jgi:hypothetical protein